MRGDVPLAEQTERTDEFFRSAAEVLRLLGNESADASGSTGKHTHPSARGPTSRSPAPLPVCPGSSPYVTLLADQLHQDGLLNVRQAAWYEKSLPTVSDALASVRRHLWSYEDMSHTRSDHGCGLTPAPLFRRLASAGLGRSLRRNTLAAGIFTGSPGAMGAGGSAAIAAAAGVAGALLALPAVAGPALVGGAAAAGYGAAYRHSLRKLAEALERMLQAVDAHARTGGAFAPASRPGAPGDDGGAGATAALVASTIV